MFKLASKICRHCIKGAVVVKEYGDSDEGKRIVARFVWGTCPCCGGTWWNCSTCCEEHG